MIMPIMLIVGGVICAGLLDIMPWEYSVIVPDYFKMLLFIVGIIFAFMGYMIYWMRARSTGACWLIEKPRLGHFNALYVFDDGEIRITPAIRAGEAQAYIREVDAQVPVIRTYHIGDHSVLVIPEGVGCAGDLDYALYADLLDSRYGFDNLRAVRDDIFGKVMSGIGLNLQKTKESVARVATGQDIGKIAERIKQQRKERYSGSPDNL